MATEVDSGGLQVTRAGAPLYSPRQIFWATFLAGPFALMYLMAQNYRALGRPDEAKQTMNWGVPACLVLLVLVAVLPGKISFALFIGCAVAGRQLARDRHFGGAKTPPPDEPLQSSLRTLMVAIVALLAWACCAVVVFIVLQSLGVRIPD